MKELFQNRMRDSHAEMLKRILGRRLLVVDGRRWGRIGGSSRCSKVQ